MDLLGTALNGVVTLGAAFGGFVLAGRNQRTGDVRAADRERAQHARDVAARLAEERHRDQLTLLRTVQDEIQEVGRNTARIILWDETLVLEGADSSALPPDLNAEDHAARVRLSMSVSRVLDDDVRTAVDRLVEELAKLVQPSFLAMRLNPEQARQECARRLDVVTILASRTLDQVGAAVRAEAAWEPPQT